MSVNKEKDLPPSREVRLKDNVLQGDLEIIAFDIYTGSAGTLATSMAKLELVVELQRSKAVEGFASLLRRRLIADGYIVVSTIDDTISEYHEEQMIGPRQNWIIEDEE